MATRSVKGAVIGRSTRIRFESGLDDPPESDCVCATAVFDDKWGVLSFSDRLIGVRAAASRETVFAAANCWPDWDVLILDGLLGFSAASCAATASARVDEAPVFLSVGSLDTRRSTCCGMSVAWIRLLVFIGNTSQFCHRSARWCYGLRAARTRSREITATGKRKGSSLKMNDAKAPHARIQTYAPSDRWRNISSSDSRMFSRQ